MPSTVRELLFEYQTVFIKYEIDNSQFWDLSLYEIGKIITAKAQFYEEQQKSNIIMNYSLAQNIAVFVNMVMAGKQIPKIQDMYPELFKEEQPEMSDEELREKNWQFYKEQMLDFANRYNAKRAKDKLKEGVNTN